MRRFWRKIPRQLRFALDALLVLALLTAVYVALGCPILGETALFRRAEKANLMGTTGRRSSFGPALAGRGAGPLPVWQRRRGSC